LKTLDIIESFRYYLIKISQTKMKPTIFILLFTILLPLGGCVTSSYNLATQREEVSFISSDKEENMGRNLAKQVEKKFELEPDALMQKKVKEIGKRIADVCDRKSISYHFAVLAGDEDDKVNAFALPGGYVFVFAALVNKAESDDELAGVIAHEVAHITARHSVKRMQASLGDTILRLALARGEMDNATRAKANEALNQLMFAYSREDEMLADRLGVKYLKLAGYNPEGMITFLGRLLEMKRKAPIRKYRHYKSHPYLSERLSIVKEAVYGHMDFTDYINRGDESLPVK